MHNWSRSQIIVLNVVGTIAILIFLAACVSSYFTSNYPPGGVIVSPEFLTLIAISPVPQNLGNYETSGEATNDVLAAQANQDATGDAITNQLDAGNDPSYETAIAPAPADALQWYKTDIAPHAQVSGYDFSWWDGISDVDCANFQTHAEAQAFFVWQGGPQRDPYFLDGDSDGIACEGLR